MRARQGFGSHPEMAMSTLTAASRRCVRSPGRRAKAALRPGDRRREGAERPPRPCPRSRACTRASGASGPTSAPIGASSVRPTAGSIASAARDRPPPSSTTASPTARTSMLGDEAARLGRRVDEDRRSRQTRVRARDEIRRPAERGDHALEPLRRRAASRARVSTPQRPRPRRARVPRARAVRRRAPSSPRSRRSSRRAPVR